MNTTGQGVRDQTVIRSKITEQNNHTFLFPQEKMCVTSKPVRNPTPGAKYLKKSPSPDGVKAPPGYLVEEASISRAHHAHPPVPEAMAYIADEDSIYSRRDSNISYDSELALKNSAANGHEAVPTNKNGGRDVADVCNGDDGQLGTLHCTARYDFDKSALVVTVNRCRNLPAKDASAKSRYGRMVRKRSARGISGSRRKEDALPLTVQGREKSFESC